LLHKALSHYGGGVEHSPRLGFQGFTLAEVLITLGIIGVVAAMTIPTLVADYQAKSWNTSAQVFERKLTEALKVMNTQQALAGYTTTEAFIDELKKHIKITKTCNNTKLMDCFGETITMRNNPVSVDLTSISTSADLGQGDWDTNLVGAQFANGTTALIAYNPNCKQDPYSNSVTGKDCLAILYDTSGYKSPNHLSKDLRANEYVKKIGTKSICALEIGSTCYATLGFKPTPHIWNACDADGNTTDSEDLELMQNYGINKCLRSDYGYKKDYWAGAVITCGGIDKMPTSAQLAELATYIYGTTTSATGSTDCPRDNNGTRTICRDDTKALSLGLNITPNSYFTIWSNKENSAGHAYTRHYDPKFTMWTTGGRFGDGHQAICLAD